jgi:hypothetical protein
LGFVCQCDVKSLPVFGSLIFGMWQVAQSMPSFS